MAKKGSGEIKKEQKEDDEDIEFDFSKVKNIFSNLGKKKIKEAKESERKEDKDEEDEIHISLDFKGVLNFFQKYKVLFLILIPVLLAIFLRIQTANLPVTDQFATQTVVNSIKAQMRAQIDAKYPNLPEQNKVALIDQEFSKFANANKAQLDQQIRATSAYFRSQLQDDNGLTYLITIDPYYWLRHAKNIVENGHPGDILKDGKPYDTYMLAPLGRVVPYDTLYAYLLAYSYKFMRLFSSVSLEKVAFFLPVFISALSIIPVFFIVRKFADNLGGFFASLVLASHHGFLVRSMAGISDTDPFSIFFPLMITWLFLEAFEAESAKKGVLLGFLAGLFVGVYSFGWLGWWYIFDFMLAGGIIYFAYYIAINRKELSSGFSLFAKKRETVFIFTILIVFFISSMVFVTFFAGMEQFKSFYIGPSGFLKLKEVAGKTIWPNVFTTVAEQNPSSLPQVIDSIGGDFLFFISMVGILLTTFKKKEGKEFSENDKKEAWFFGISTAWLLIVIIALQQNLYYFLAGLAAPILMKIIMSMSRKEDIDFKFASLMILWFVGTLFASVNGVRYLLLLVPAYSIGFGIFAGLLYLKFPKWLAEELKANEKLSKAVVFVILCLLLVGPVQEAYATAFSRTTDMNDAWWNALKKIDREAQKDAIINSWWDFGHWFKAIGNRRVTFDGTSQESSPVHWVGKALVTDNEKQAVAILRMLDCGNYLGTTELNKYLQDDLKTLEVTNSILSIDREDAKKVLIENGLKDDEAESVLKYTHCTPPEDYFITSEDMVLKSAVWAHFGLWDFKKAAMYNAVSSAKEEDGVKTLMERFGLDQQTADRYYYEIKTQNANDWISVWPKYDSRISSCSIEGNATVICSNGLIVNLTDYSAELPRNNANKKLKSLAYLDKNGFHEKIMNEDGELSAALMPKGQSFDSIYLDPMLTKSMFTRLFFFKGHGLKYFKPFSHETSIFGADIYVWKIDWEGKEANVIDEFKNKTTEKTSENLSQQNQNQVGNNADNENILNQ